MLSYVSVEWSADTDPPGGGEIEAEMTDRFDGDAAELSPFPGLVPSEPPRTTPRPPGRLGRGLRKTIPIVVASAMTVGLNITAPVDAVAASPKKPMKPRADLASAVRGLVAGARVATTPGAAATSYTVQAGDTVAAIAVRHGLSTASVLALNGLGWKSLIFPGQVLKLSPAAKVAAVAAPQEGGRYTIVPGDTVPRVAARFGVSVEALLTANGLGWSSIIYPGQTIAIPPAPPPPAPEPAMEAVSSVAPAESAPAPSASTTHTIQSGETVSSIAALYGVSTQAVLDANGLSTSSIIYPGGVLVIPAPGSSSGGGGGAVTGLTGEQEGNARIIIQVGREQGVPDYGIIIALATAMQESSLRNLDWGDLDSIGLFQQRPVSGWGTVEEIMNPYHAAYLFYQGRAGYTRGLLDIAGWQSMPLTVAAQRVQISAYPDAYAKWESSARAWFAALA